MEEEWGERIPLQDRRGKRAAMEASSSRARAETLTWSDVWYRLDEGRGTFSLDNLNHRVNVSIDSMQAVQQAKEVLRKMDTKNSGIVQYIQFKRCYDEQCSEWEQAALVRLALDVQDNPPTQEEEGVFQVWMKLVDYTIKNPSRQDFNWHLILPDEYDRSRLVCYTYYRSELVHPQRVTDWLLNSPVVDSLPNNTVVQLLEKCLEAMPKADINNDGYIEYQEFRRFIDGMNKVRAGAVATGTWAVRRGALATIPRRERTLETRRYLEEYSCRPPPVFMILFTIAEIITFIIYAVDMGLPTEGSSPCPIYSPLVYHPERRYQAWRYLTYALIHSGWVHLVNNLVVQLFLGVLLELVHKWRVVLVYVAGVAAGSLAHSLYRPDYFLAGASGGVYAVEYAHLGNLILNWSEMERPVLQLLALLLLMSLDLGYAIWNTITDPNTATGHMSHLGGAVAGILVGIVVLRNLKKVRWEAYCWWISLVLFIVLLLCGIFLNIFLPIFPDSDWSPISEDRDEWMQQNH